MSWSDGMGSYDITFCQNINCENKECLRHQDRLKDYPYSISIARFTDCEFWKNGEEYSIEELLK